MKDPAGLVLALTINAYWMGVLLLSALRRLQHRQGVGLVPAKSSERTMWFIWVPIVLAWNVLPQVALHNHHMPWGLSEAARVQPVIQAVRFLAAGWAVCCFLVTLHCWIKMGRSWSMAVVPDRPNSLVQSGLFGLVRHPIYALSMALMIGSVAVVLTPPMAIVGLVHITALILKARSEEQFLLATHGQSYLEYTRRTGRFLPRLLPPA
jgi:protein-S-isoprenylcysteine O-methyltransferase Ste14